MPLKLPALDPADVAPRSKSGYPEPFRSRVLPREKRAIGDALGLTKVGVNLTTLPPGKESSMRHFHTREDELIFVVEGEVTLRTDEGEQILTAGMCAGFPAGVPNGHQLVNRSDRPARYLEISNRDPQDSAAYPDIDLVCTKAPDGTLRFKADDWGAVNTEAHKLRHKKFGEWYFTNLSPESFFDRFIERLRAHALPYVLEFHGPREVLLLPKRDERRHKEVMIE